jgi:hypothetical protein
MVQHPGGTRFLLEALDPLLIAERERGKDLHRHIAAEARVLGAIHRSHAALAEEADDPIRTEHLIRLEHRHRGSSWRVPRNGISGVTR